MLVGSRAVTCDLPDHLREVIPDGWQFSLWPYMQEWPGGGLLQMGTHYALSTTHEGRKISLTTLIGNPLRRQPWFPTYEREHVVSMVTSIRTEIARKG